jgi:hypothetical protein
MRPLLTAWYLAHGKSEEEAIAQIDLLQGEEAADPNGERPAQPEMALASGATTTGGDSGPSASKNSG